MDSTDYVVTFDDKGTVESYGQENFRERAVRPIALPQQQPAYQPPKQINCDTTNTLLGAQTTCTEQ